MHVCYWLAGQIVTTNRNAFPCVMPSAISWLDKLCQPIEMRFLALCPSAIGWLDKLCQPIEMCFLALCPSAIGWLDKLCQPIEILFMRFSPDFQVGCLETTRENYSIKMGHGKFVYYVQLVMLCLTETFHWISADSYPSCSNLPASTAYLTKKWCWTRNCVTR